MPSLAHAHEGHDVEDDMAGEVVELDIAMDISWGYGDGGRARRGLSSNRWCACESCRMGKPRVKIQEAMNPL